MSNYALQNNSQVQGTKLCLALNLTINHFRNILLVHMGKYCLKNLGHKDCVFTN